MQSIDIIVYEYYSIRQAMFWTWKYTNSNLGLVMYVIIGSVELCTPSNISINELEIPEHGAIPTSFKFDKKYKSQN